MQTNRKHFVWEHHMTSESLPKTVAFEELGLPEHILKSLQKLNFTTPTPIQAQAIPPLLAGVDVLGQAQTGTGKTAAFALPLLTKIQAKRREPQILVLVPTRELALQVAEAFHSFAANMPEINILPIYGGQSYNTQLSGLRKGAHVIIGTPGRVMDHMRRETLRLDSLKTIILDEADEMLRMGFAEDVEWVLQQAPTERQIGLFSATMPPAIKKIAEAHLNNPQRITVKSKTSTATTIKQFYCLVNGAQKVDAVSRILETEESDAVIVFVKTKRATEELAEELSTRGFSAVAINGDIVQKQRERVIEQLKSGRIKILIATDVAARGIDVERITHVINYDAPNNAESYIHRIGRTGRAGRNGTAIIFITPRERFILRNIENTTKHPIEELAAPSINKVNEKRISAFKQRISTTMTQNTSFFESLLEEYVQENSASPIKVAAALAKLFQGDKPLVLSAKDNLEVKVTTRESRGRESNRRSDFGNDRRRSFRDRPADDRTEFGGERRRSFRDRPADDRAEFGGERRSSFRDRPTDDRTEFGSERKRGHKEQMDQYRVDVGRDDGISPKNLVGAIANSAGLAGHMIGKIKIEAKFSLVDLPRSMPKNIQQSLQRLKLGGKQMSIKKVKNN